MEDTYTVYVELIGKVGNTRKQHEVIGHMIEDGWVQLVGTDQVHFYRSDQVALVRLPNRGVPEDAEA